MGTKLKMDFDLVVLGSGPAGYPAAIRGSQMGASVCLIEKERLGGTCLNWGCIPTKTLHGLAHLVDRLRGSGDLILGCEDARPDPESLFEKKRKIVGELVSGVEELLRGRKVRYVRGEGRITGDREIDVEGVGRVRGKAMLIATGSHEVSLPNVEFDGGRILGSKELLDLNRIPRSLLVIGGGVIGCEFASIFNALGSKVTVVEMLPALVSTEDAQIGRYLGTYFRRKGIVIHTGSKVVDVVKGRDAVTASLDNGKEVSAEIVLVSVGRRPNISGIGLEETGVEVDPAGVKVDGGMHTSVDGVYAAGDVVGGMLLAHVATREGVVAAENALGGESEVRYDAIPSTVYTLPEISHVGLTEKEAGERGIEYDVGRFPFAANGKAKGLGEEEGFVKWIASKADGRLLGVHIIGPQATELLSAGILAVGRGMTARDFTTSVFPHPTLSESLMEAAEAVEGRAIHVL